MNLQKDSKYLFLDAIHKNICHIIKIIFFNQYKFTYIYRIKAWMHTYQKYNQQMKVIIIVQGFIRTTTLFELTMI